MLLDSKTYQQQSSFAAFCRSGDLSVLRGVDKERADQYHRLVFNVVLDTLSSAYPLTKQLLGDKAWEELVRMFFRDHNCSSPQVWKMPMELIGYVEETELALKDKYLFLPELLLFEWLEIECFMQPDRRALFDTKEDNGGKIVINPESNLQYFTFPVHLKNASEIEPVDQGDYFLVLHRHPVSKKVLFADLGLAYALIVDFLSQGPLSRDVLVNNVMMAMGMEKTKGIEKQIDEFISNSFKTNLFLGYKK